MERVDEVRRPVVSPVSKEERQVESNELGTFGGVFTPSILTILGVIMFMRAGFVVGQAGIFQALLILLLAKSISTLTSLSVAAVSTNTPVAGGGAYFLISRSLGPEFGGAIGLALFLAQAVSVPFYVLGFTESVVREFRVDTPFQGHFLGHRLPPLCHCLCGRQVGHQDPVPDHGSAGALGRRLSGGRGGPSSKRQTFLRNWPSGYSVPGCPSGWFSPSTSRP